MSEEEIAHAKTRGEAGARLRQAEVELAKLQRQVRESEIVLQEHRQWARKFEALKHELALAKDHEVDGLKRRLTSANERAAQLKVQSKALRQQLEVEGTNLARSEAARRDADKKVCMTQEELFAMEEAMALTEKRAVQQLEEAQLRLASVNALQSSLDEASAVAVGQAARAQQLEKELLLLRNEVEATKPSQPTNDSPVQGQPENDKQGLEHNLDDRQEKEAARLVALESEGQQYALETHQREQAWAHAWQRSDSESPASRRSVGCQSTVCRQSVGSQSTASRWSVSSQTTFRGRSVGCQTWVQKQQEGLVCVVDGIQHAEELLRRTAPKLDAQLQPEEHSMLVHARQSNAARQSSAGTTAREGGLGSSGKPACAAGV